MKKAMKKHKVKRIKVDPITPILRGFLCYLMAIEAGRKGTKQEIIVKEKSR